MEKPSKTPKVMDINQKLSIMQTKFKSKKSRFNNFGKYNFRSAEDILEAIKPFLLELDVTVTINETLITEMAIPVIQSDARISDGKNAIHATAVVGVDLNQKGMQTPQQFGSASSYAKKYSLGNLLLIDDTQDSELHLLITSRRLKTISSQEVLSVLSNQSIKCLKKLNQLY